MTFSHRSDSHTRGSAKTTAHFLIILPAGVSGQGRNPFSRLPFFLPAILLFVLSMANPASGRSRDDGGPSGSWRSACPASPLPRHLQGEHYSPEENLESLDVALINRATKTIDIAMYAFTDRPIAEAIVRAAKRGVRIRIYRDRIQVRDRGDKTRFLLSSPEGRSHIRVLVKHNSFRNIMHLKAYVIDRTYLRTGSANWSPPGEGAYCRRHHRSLWNQQDNNLFVTKDSREIRHFEKTFSRIFSRTGDPHGNRSWHPPSRHHSGHRHTDRGDD